MPTAAHEHTLEKLAQSDAAPEVVRDVDCASASGVVHEGRSADVPSTTGGSCSARDLAAVGATCGRRTCVVLPDGWEVTTPKRRSVIAGVYPGGDSLDLVVQGSGGPGELGPLALVDVADVGDDEADDWVELAAADAVNGMAGGCPLDIQVGRRPGGEPSVSVLSMVLVEDQPMTVLRYSWREVARVAGGRVSKESEEHAPECGHVVVSIQFQCRSAEFARWEADFVQMMGTIRLGEVSCA